MKKLNLFISAILLAHFCFAQPIKTIRVDLGSLVEKYGVLKSDKTIRQGKYELTSAYSGSVIISGFYKNNKMDSIWQSYIQKRVSAQGTYKNGFPYGEWMVYDNKGNITTKYDYTENKILLHKTVKADTSMRHVLVDGQPVFTKLDRAPVYMYGDDFMFNMIAQSVRYPGEARVQHIIGKVVIAFVVDENGQTRDYHVVEGIGGGCDEEALRVVKTIPVNWLPGQLNGKPVAVVYSMPISFSIR